MDRSLFSRVLRDPLTHFVIIGLLLFAVTAWLRPELFDEANPKRIHVSKQKQQHLASLFQQSWQRPPTDDELTRIIDDYILEEIYYREALELGLDRNDTVVRRRLRQKMEFLQESLTSEERVEEQQLEDWYQQNQGDYRLPRTFSFEQVLLGNAPEVEPAELAAQLSQGDTTAQEVSTSGLLPIVNNGLNERQISDRFGEEFLRGMSSIETDGDWHGPVASVFGQHLVKIVDVDPARIAPFEQVIDRVRQDYLRQQSVARAQSAQERLRSQYVIVID